jgi:membrane protein YqaA with SNARE-associated domain
VLGSALTVVLGMMRANIPITVLAMALGKIIRYALVIGGTLGVAALL